MTYNKKVIEFPDKGTLWAFEDYVEGGNNPIQEWYDTELSDEAQMMFNNVLKNCQKIGDPSKWEDSRGFLKGECDGHKIWELGFRSDNKQHRIFGIFSAEKRRHAILLIGCYHKQKRYTPDHALATAVKRKKALDEGRATTVERKIDIDQ